MASRRAGRGHWLAQRLTALALAPLSFWFLYAGAMRADASHAVILEWVEAPGVAIALLALLVIGAWHSMQGIEVVVVDYVRDRSRRQAALALAWGFVLALATLGVLAVASVSLS